MLHKLTAAATAGIEKTRISSNDLKLGMYVRELDRPWLDSPFLVHGFTVRTEQQLQQIRQLCRFVYIDITRGNSASDRNRGSKPKQTTHYQQTRDFAEHLADSTRVYDQTKVTVDHMFETFSAGRSFDTSVVREVIKDCVDHIAINPDPMLWLSRIKHKDQYTAEHSVNVAMLSMVLGRAEGLQKQDLEDLGVCAMLHDVGKVKIPDDILNKEGNLDEKEFKVMQMHAVHGKKLLMGTAGLPDAAIDIALSHHEKLDGSGYPRGLSGAQIPYLVRLVAIADAYDAITSARIYSGAKPPGEALKLLLSSKNEHHDAQLIQRFIDCIGIYPIGSIAELNSGEAGIVLPTDNANKLQPKVLICTDAAKQLCKTRKIDLSTDCRPDNGRPYLIRALHVDGTYGLRLADYRDSPLKP